MLLYRWAMLVRQGDNNNVIVIARLLVLKMEEPQKVRLHFQSLRNVEQCEIK